MYQVIDRQTGEVMGTYQTRSRADRRADKLDNEYGAYRYYAQEKPDHAKELFQSGLISQAEYEQGAFA